MTGPGRLDSTLAVILPVLLGVMASPALARPLASTALPGALTTSPAATSSASGSTRPGTLVLPATDPTSLGLLPAEKLPVELPAITVIGHQQHPEARRGSKLTPGTDAELMALPPPALARATNDFLAHMQLAVPAPPGPPAHIPAAADREPYTAIWGDLGGVPEPGMLRYDFGFAHGRVIGSALSLTDLRAFANGLDRWSVVKANERLSWGPTNWADLSYRRDQETPGTQATLQEGGSARARWDRHRLSLGLGVDLGHVQVGDIRADVQGGPALSSSDETWLYDLAVDASYAPKLAWRAHALKLDLLVGQQGTSETGTPGWSAPHAEIGAQDTWSLDPRWRLDYGLAATTLGQVGYLDPAVKVSFLPGGGAGLHAGGLLRESPTKLWLAARTTTDLPGFSRLYLDRLQVEGNGSLRPERTQPEAEIGAGHRFSDKLYGDASFRYGDVLDFIYYGQAGQGLWQPRNFASWQGVYQVRAGAQYLFGDGFVQHFDIKVQDATALGQILESIGTRHESSWLGGKLTASVGTSLEYAQLGPTQAPGGSAAGMAWLASWDVGYEIAPGWKLYCSGNDWHVLALQEPAPGYFATPALVSGGLEVTF